MKSGQKENIGYVLQKLTDYEYTRACKHIDNLCENDIKDKIKRIAVKYRNFDIAEEIYKEIYSSIPDR